MARSALRAAAFTAAIGASACGSTPTTPVVPRLSITKILAFGDSLTEGEATPSDAGFTAFFVHPTNDPGLAKGYPYKLLTLLTQRYTTQTISVYNGGYGGRLLSDDATDQADRTLGEFLDAFNPQVMILIHGTNDLNREDTLPVVQTVAGYAGALIDKAQARGVSVIVSSLPPRLAGGTPDRAKNPQLVAPYNSALQVIAAQKNAPYVNVYSPIIQNLAGPDMAPDGLHLTEAGNDKLAAVYFSALKLLYETIK